MKKILQMILMLSFSLPALAEWKELSCSGHRKDGSAWKELIRYDPDTQNVEKEQRDGFYVMSGGYVTDSAIGFNTSGLYSTLISRVDGEYTGFKDDVRWISGTCVKFKQAF